MLKTKKGYLIRSVGKKYMVVAIGKASEEFHGMIQLNETGAFYWKEMEKGIEKDDLVKKIRKRFEELDEAAAREALEEFVQSISFAVEEV